MDFQLLPLAPCDLSQFKRDMREAFQLGAEAASARTPAPSCRNPISTHPWPLPAPGRGRPP